MAEPELRVRLTAEGQAEVVAALRTVLREGQAVGRASTGIGTITGALGRLRGVLGPLTGALAGISFVGIIRGAADASQRLLNASEVMGVTLDTARSLSLVADQAGTSVGAIAGKIAIFAKTSTDALRGDPEALGLFRAIGLTKKEIESFRGADVAQRLEIVGKAFGRLSDGPAKTAAQVALLKRGMQDLLPVINQIAREGFPTLGFTASEASLRSANTIGNSLATMNAQIRELAIEFTAGLAPQVTASLKAVTDELGKSGSAAREWGELFGGAIVAAVSATVTGLDSILTEIRVFNISLNGLIAKLTAPTLDLAQQAEKLADEKIQKAYRESKERRDAFIRRLQDLEDKGKRPRSLGPGLGEVFPSREARAGGGVEATDEEAAKRKTELKRARIEADLKITQAGLKLEEAENENAFARELVTFQAYWDRREKIAIAGVNAEINALGQRRELIEADPSAKNRAAELAKINADIEAQAIHRAEILTGLDQKRFEAAKKVHEEMEKSLRTQTQFERVSQAAGLALDSFGRDRSAIQDRIDAGLLSEIQGQAKIQALEKERIANLRAIGALLVKSAVGPEEEAQAQDYLRSIDQIQIAIKQVNDITAQVKTTAVDEFGASLVREFGEGELAAISWKNTTKAVLLDVLGALRRFTTQLLITRAIAAFLSLFAKKDLGAHQLSPDRSPIPPPLPGFATGGLLIGIGSGTSDSNVGRFSHMEYAMPADRVKEPGMLEHLEALRRGTIKPYEISTQPVPPRSSDTPGRLEGSLAVDLSPDLVPREIRQPRGEQAVLEVVVKNRRAVRAAIGI